jgi:Orn/Lys/Arg decarboxylase-like protein
MLMPGESTGSADGPYLSYLRALQSWDKCFPGLGHDTHGVENVGGTYYIYCLKPVGDSASLSDTATEVVESDEHTCLSTR